MKKILYVLLTILLYVTSTSLTSSTKEVKVTGKDTTVLNLNVNAKVTANKEQIQTNEQLNQYLISAAKLNEVQAIVIQDFNNRLEEYSSDSTKKEQLEKLGWSQQIIVKRVRADTTINLICDLFLLLSSIILLYWFTIYSTQNDIDWKVASFIVIAIIILIVVSKILLPYIISYIFNREYLVLKEVNLFL